MVEAEFAISIQAQGALAVGAVDKPHLPQLHVIVQRDEKRLRALDAVGLAKVGGIAEAVAALIASGIKRAAHGLPAQRPVRAGIVIAHVYVMSGPVKGYA